MLYYNIEGVSDMNANAQENCNTCIESVGRMLGTMIRPIQQSIEKLEVAQKEMATIITTQVLTVQARLDENSKHVKIDIDNCHAKVRDIEKSSANIAWDIAKLIIAATIGAVVTAAKYSK